MIHFTIKNIITHSFFLLLLSGQLEGQNLFRQAAHSAQSKQINIETIYQNGYVFPTNDFVRGINSENDTISNFQTLSIQLGKQTIGEKTWEQLFNFPEYGLGVYFADFHNPEEIGLPIAFYGFFSAPFHRWNRFSFNYSLRLGFAFNWKAYSPTNTYNIAIGAKETAYIDLGINTEFHLNKTWWIAFGTALSHFSNGRLKEPNFGLNTIAPQISLKYNFSGNDLDFNKQAISDFKKNNDVYLSSFTGIKNILYDSLNIAASEKFEGESYYVFGIAATFNRQITYKSKFGFGFDIIYDGSVSPQIAISNGELHVTRGPFSDQLKMSVFPSYEFVVNKVSVLLQPSFYIFRKEISIQIPKSYQRIGLKYNFFKKLYLGLNLRAYQYHVSDFIEWNIGYSL